MRGRAERIAQSARRLLADDRARYGVLLCAVLGCLYALLQNGYWTPASDSEVYLTTARNILAGRGYVFSGVPVAHYPPGWPLFLAGVMALSRSFWVLNAVAKLLLLCAAFLYYRLLLRLTDARRAFVCVLTAATLWLWFHWGYALMSESLFIFLVASALVVALQVRDGRTKGWRIAGLILLCMALAATRWAGVIAAGVVALTAIGGELKPRLNRKWCCFVLIILASCATFASLRWLTRSGVLAPTPVAGPTVAQPDDSSPAVPGGNADAKKIARKMVRLGAVPVVHSHGLSRYLRKLGDLGASTSRLFWPVAKLAPTYRLVNLVFSVVGWVLLVFVINFAWRQARHKDWLWVGLVLCMVLLTLIRKPKGRYLAPFAPLWIHAIWAGSASLLERVARGAPPLWRGVASHAPACFIGFVLTCNMVVYLSAAWVQRADDYYATFRAGQYKDLVNMAEYIARNAPTDARIAVSLQRENLGRTKTSRGTVATLVLLTDRTIVAGPPLQCIKNGGDQASAQEWMKKRGVSYLLLRLPTSPWRLWHFRVPWLQRWVTGQKDIPHNPYWVFYRMADGVAERVWPPEAKDYPRRVPPIARRDDGGGSGEAPSE